MEHRRVSKQRFFALHEACVPALYQAALWLSESRACAEQAAAQAFLDSMRVPALQNDARDFTAQAFRRLLTLCRQARADEPGKRDALLPAPLQSLTYSHRELAVLAALGKAAPEIALIVDRPLCLTKWWLRLLPCAVDTSWLTGPREPSCASQSLF